MTQEEFRRIEAHLVEAKAAGSTVFAMARTDVESLCGLVKRYRAALEECEIEAHRGNGYNCDEIARTALGGDIKSDISDKPPVDQL